MKGKARRILDVWGYYRLSTLLLLMIIFLVFAGFVCSSASGAGFDRSLQPRCSAMGPDYIPSGTRVSDLWHTPIPFQRSLNRF